MICMLCVLNVGTHSILRRTSFSTPRPNFPKLLWPSLVVDILIASCYYHVSKEHNDEDVLCLLESLSLSLFNDLLVLKSREETGRGNVRVGVCAYKFRLLIPTVFKSCLCRDRLRVVIKYQSYSIFSSALLVVQFTP